MSDPVDINIEVEDGAPVELVVESGVPGARGFTGSAGAGFVGSRGADGPLGYTGSRGAGYTGSRGATGFVGSSGLGYTGSRGVGFTGSKGAIGFTGSHGTGFTGSKGASGDTGSLGYTGSKGEQGVIGFVGSRGVAGTNGYTGSKGADGSAGGLGYTGSRGLIGYTGSAGGGGGGSLTSVQSILTSDVSIYVGFMSSWVDVLEVTITPGTWLITAHFSLTPSGSSTNHTWMGLLDGSTELAVCNIVNQQSGVYYARSGALSRIYTVGVERGIKLRACRYAGTDDYIHVKAELEDDSGLFFTSGATILQAVKIG